MLPAHRAQVVLRLEPDRQVRDGFGVKLDDRPKSNSASATTSSTCPALRRSSGVSPVSRTCCRVSHSHAVRELPMIAVIRAMPSTGRPSTGRAGRRCLRSPLSSPIAAPRLCQSYGVDRLLRRSARLTAAMRSGSQIAFRLLPAATFANHHFSGNPVAASCRILWLGMPQKWYAKQPYPHYGRIAARYRTANLMANATTGASPAPARKAAHRGPLITQKEIEPCLIDQPLKATSKELPRGPAGRRGARAPSRRRNALPWRFACSLPGPSPDKRAKPHR